MYSRKPSIVYGFHGTDKQVALDILNQNTEFVPSDNSYDWLGGGVYFWEGDLLRAKRFATESSKRNDSSIQEPFAIGAIIDLGNCLDLLNQKYLDLLKIAYEELKNSLMEEGKELPENTGFGDEDFNFRKRELDCAVIRMLHQMIKEEDPENPFDTVRAAFWEGEPLYEGAGFRSKNHIQIAVLNLDCIKGVFLPRNTQA